MTFLTPDFLFQINRVRIEPIDEAFLYIGIAMVVLAFVFKLAARLSPSSVDAKYREKFFSLFVSIGFSVIVWFAARAQLVRFFGTHFVVLLVLFVGLVWFVWIVVKMAKNYRKEKQAWDKEQMKRKYLP